MTMTKILRVPFAAEQMVLLDLCEKFYRTCTVRNFISLGTKMPAMRTRSVRKTPIFAPSDIKSPIWDGKKVPDEKIRMSTASAVRSARGKPAMRDKQGASKWRTQILESERLLIGTRKPIDSLFLERTKRTIRTDRDKEKLWKGQRDRKRRN